MSRGPSGRIVVEVEPNLKRRLYSELVREGLTFKDWLIKQAERYIADQEQPRLFGPASPTPPSGTKGGWRQ